MSEPDDYAAELYEARFRRANPHWSERDYEEYFHQPTKTNTDDTDTTTATEEDELSRHLQED